LPLIAGEQRDVLDAGVELLADRAGVYPYYCNLTLEDGCRSMVGQLVVLPEEEASR
jgi:hypothetical protein